VTNGDGVKEEAGGAFRGKSVPYLRYSVREVDTLQNGHIRHIGHIRQKGSDSGV
jgi:hypothetical protein